MLSQYDLNNVERKIQQQNQPASVDTLDACPIGDQEVVCSIPARSATFFGEY